MTSTSERGSIAKIKDETQYYEHQIVGIRQMARMGSFLLADEMGLGKSLQALTVAAIDFEMGFAKRVIVIAPASLKWNWQDECEKFTNFKAMVLDGTPTERKAQLSEFEMMDYDVLIVNYEQVAAHLEALNGLSFDIGIWDEAHYLKNPKAKRTKASHDLYVRRAFCLTGSPMLNQVNELWGVLHRINPEYWPAYYRFVNRYCVFGGWKNKQIVGVKHKQELVTDLDQVMVRRLKKDVLAFLPEKQRIVVHVDLSKEQRRLYDYAKKHGTVPMPGEQADLDLENPLARMTRYRQIAATAMPFTGEDDSTKLDRAVELAGEVLERGEPVVIFTQFMPVLECLERRFGDVGVPTYTLRGSVPKEMRSEVCKQWGSHAERKGRPAVMLAGLQVAGVGLNMTQASTCIFVDKLYVPKLNEQAVDRLHRIGVDTTRPVQIIELIARDTVEQRVEAMLRKKSHLFDSVVEDNEWKKIVEQALAEEAA